jgi:hypothetical protein
MIEARNLTKRNGDRTAVDDLSFTVQRGHFTGSLACSTTPASTAAVCRSRPAITPSESGVIPGGRYLCATVRGPQPAAYGRAGQDPLMPVSDGA